MKKYSSILLSFLTIILIHTKLNSQILQQKTIGGLEEDTPTRVLKTQDNKLLIAGYSNSGIAYEKTEVCRGEEDYWIIKLDTNLNIEWQKTLGGVLSDKLWEIVETSNGDFICVGASLSPISGDKTTSNNGDADFWILKLDNQGDILWQKTFGGNQIDIATTLIQFDDGSFLIGGSSNSNISGDKSEPSRGGVDYWIIKIDSSGNKVWDKTYGGSNDDALKSIKLLNNSEIILSGITLSNISGEKTENSYGYTDLWIIKIDTSGNVIWDKTLGGGFHDSNGDMQILNNNIYVASQSLSDSSGTKTENSMGGSDFWLIKLNSNGDIIWDKTILGDLFDVPINLTLSQQNTLFISGLSDSGIYADKTEPSNGAYDYWLVEIDENKSIKWQKTIGGNNWDQLQQSINYSQNEVLLLGKSNSPISGDKIEDCRGNFDFWIAKVNYVINGISFPEHFKIEVFPNPASQEIFIQMNDLYNSSARVEIFDISGKKIISTQINTNIQKVNISNLSSGIYILNVLLPNINHTTKFVKN